MGKSFKNESGAALIMVLLTIALIMLFSTVMMNNILTNTKQNNVVEHHNRATHIAEMGVSFVKNQFTKYLKEHNVALNKSELQGMVHETITNVEAVEIDANHPDRYFELEPHVNIRESSEGANVSVHINGYDGKFSESMSITFSLGKGRIPIEDWDSDSATPPEPPSNPDYLFEEDVSWKKNCPSEENSTYVITGSLDTKNCDDAEIGSLYLDGPLTIKSSVLTVNGTAVINGIDINTLTQAVIKGNAYINSTLTSGNNPNSMFLSCGHTRSKQKIDYKGNFKVRGYVIADDQVIFSNNPAIFGSDAILKNGLILNGTDLSVGGDLTIKVDSAFEEFHTQLGGDIYVSGDLILKFKDGKTIVNPGGDSFHTGADVQISFPECENAPPLETSSDLEINIENGSY